MPAPPRSLSPAHAARLLERLAVLVLLLAAAVPRSLDLGTGFDRGFEGWQGSFFAISAVNYERFGPARFRGYPALLVDLGEESSPAALGPGDALVYANHPPTTPLLAWASARLLGPAGWADAWRSGEAPRGLEPALRLPFLLLHLAGLFAFYWALRQGFGPGVAVLGLALLATAPVALLYGFLVSYENPALVCVFLALGFGARFLRSGARRDGVCMGLAFAAGTSVTYAPAFFLPPLWIAALRRGRARATLALGLPAVLLPIALHAALAPDGMGAGAGLVARARELWAPLLDGTTPLSSWIRLQLGYAADALGLPLACAGALGLALCAARRLHRPLDARLARGEVRSTPEAQAPVDLALVLAAGGALYLLAFYRHTTEPQRPFQLFVAPAAAAGAACLLAGLAKPLFRLRAGIAPLVLIVAAVALPGVGRFEVLKREVRAPLPEGGEGLPLPAVTGAAWARVVPRGAVGLVPASLGLNLAPTYYAWRNVLAVPDPASPPPLLGVSRITARAPTFALERTNGAWSAERVAN